MIVWRTSRQTWIWFSAQCCESCLTGSAQSSSRGSSRHGGCSAAKLSSTTQAPCQSPGTCRPVHSAHTWPWPLKSSTPAWGAAVLFELLPLGNRELAFLCRDIWWEWELRWAAEGSALFMALVCYKLCGERKICSRSVEASLAVLEKSFPFLSSISSPSSQRKDGSSCLNLTRFLHVPCPWYVLFHALMWNLLVSDADGCRIKCTFLWLCQVDMQQRAELEKLTEDSVQSQDCLRQRFSFLKVPVKRVTVQLLWCTNRDVTPASNMGRGGHAETVPPIYLGFSHPEGFFKLSLFQIKTQIFSFLVQWLCTQVWRQDPQFWAVSSNPCYWIMGDFTQQICYKSWGQWMGMKSPKGGLSRLNTWHNKLSSKSQIWTPVMDHVP